MTAYRIYHRFALQSTYNVYVFRSIRVGLVASMAMRGLSDIAAKSRTVYENHVSLVVNTLVFAKITAIYLELTQCSHCFVHVISMLVSSLSPLTFLLFSFLRK